MNLELVFGFHLKPGTGPQVTHILNPLDKCQSNLLFFSLGSLWFHTPSSCSQPAYNTILSKLMGFIKQNLAEKLPTYVIQSSRSCSAEESCVRPPKPSRKLTAKLGVGWGVGAYLSNCSCGWASSIPSSWFCFRIPRVKRHREQNRTIWKPKLSARNRTAGHLTNTRSVRLWLHVNFRVQHSYLTSEAGLRSLGLP